MFDRATEMFNSATKVHVRSEGMFVQSDRGACSIRATEMDVRPEVAVRTEVDVWALPAGALSWAAGFAKIFPPALTAQILDCIFSVFLPVVT